MMALKLFIAAVWQDVFHFLETGIKLVWVRVGIRSMIMLGERVLIFGLPRKRFLIMLIYVANNSFFHLSVLYQ